MKQTNNSNYYVYVYLDPRKVGEYNFLNYEFNYEPFYVCKGKGNRCYKHLKETEDGTENLIKYRKIKKILNDGLKPKIIKIAKNLNEDDAYSLETILIKTIGRKKDNSGPLTNILIENKPPSNYIELSNEEINNIITDYKNGLYVKHISDKYNLGEGKINRTLLENNIKFVRRDPANKIILDSSKLDNLINDYVSGLSIRKLKDKYEISFEVVRRLLNENNVKIRGYNYKKSDEHIKKIHDKRKIPKGKESTCYRKLTESEILKLKKLRFEQKVPIKTILKLMGIGQKKYYEYIKIINNGWEST